jgi:hypothetical protein
MNLHGGKNLIYQNPSLTASARKTWGSIFIFFTLTPWAHWGTNSLDSQPWPLISGCIYILLAKKIVFIKDIVVIAWIATITMSIILLLQWPGDSLAIRAVASYLTMVVCLIVSYDYIRIYGSPLRMIYFVNAVWLIMGVAELLYPSIASTFSVSRTSEGRGVTSLAPEPTFFAIYLIFSTWLILLSCKYKPTKFASVIVFANVIAIVFLCKSTMGLLFLAIGISSILLYQFLKLRLKIVISVAVVAIVVGLTSIPNLDYLMGSRMVGVADKIGLNGMLTIFQDDESINSRLEHLVFSFDGLVRNYLFPGGFNSFGDMREVQLRAYNGFFWTSDTTDKIMSFYGSICYEFGIFGVAIVFIITKGLLQKRSLLSFFEIITFSLFALAAIPVAFAPVYLLIAMLFCETQFQNRKNDSNKKVNEQYLQPHSSALKTA